MLKVEIALANGSAMDLAEDDRFYEKLLRLRYDEFEGRQLVDELISDDWGAPPIGVRITGELSDGTVIDEYIQCETRRPRRRR
jgi:hypothetical protein